MTPQSRGNVFNLNAATAPEPARFDTAGGGGDDGGMEHRLNEVEKSIVRLDANVGHIQQMLVRMDHGISGFKWQVLAAAVALLAASGGLLFSVQQMTVSTFQAAAATADAKAPPPIIMNLPGAASPTASAAR